MGTDHPVQPHFFKRFENLLTLIFILIGAITLYTFYTLTFLMDLIP